MNNYSGALRKTPPHIEHKTLEDVLRESGFVCVEVDENGQKIYDAKRSDKAV